MPDALEVFNGTNPDVVDAEDDPDGDGIHNGDEYRAGTDPQNASSVLRAFLSDISPSSIQLSWDSVPGRGCLIQRSFDLPECGDVAESTAVSLETSVTIERTGGACFFRISAL